MNASVMITFACAVLAAAGTGVLAARCIRTPRPDVIAWACAVAGIAISLGAQSLGAHNGFGSATFRVTQIGAQLIAPLWLAWGMVELAGRSMTARFGAKLLTAALTVVAAVVLITDPLASTPFSKSWPPGHAHYQIIARSLLSLVAVVTVITVAVTLAVAALRLRRDPAWRRPLLTLGAAGAAAVAILGLRLSLPAGLAYPALCAVSAVLACCAGMMAVTFSLDELHGDGLAGEELAGEELAGEELGEQAPEVRGDRPAPARSRDDADDTEDRAFGAGYPPPPEDAGYPARADSHPAREDVGYPAREERAYPGREDVGYPARADSHPAREERAYPGREDAGYPAREERGYPAREDSGYPARGNSGAGPRFGDDNWYRLRREDQPNGGYPRGGYRPDGGRGENGDGDYRLGAGRRPGRDYPARDEDTERFEAVPAREEDTRLSEAGAAQDEEAGLPEAEVREAGLPEAEVRETGLPETGLPETGLPEAGLPETGLPETGLPETDQDAGLSEAGAAGTWSPETAAWPPGSAAGTGAEEDATQRLFGLIVIYSLAEGQDADFDALAERVVEEVRVSEPDTLVYAVHSVPNAPLQRIFYEVYRDETAYAEHREYSHIQRFDAERVPYVLTTNVIQLGTQRAKLSGLPGLSQLLRANPGD